MGGTGVGETKIVKRGSKLGQRVDALKREGWNPLTKYVLGQDFMERHKSIIFTFNGKEATF